MLRAATNHSGSVLPESLPKRFQAVLGVHQMMGAGHLPDKD
jgi:hypothetical protein